MSGRERRNVPVVDYRKLDAGGVEFQEVEDEDVTVGASVGADDTAAKTSEENELDLDQEIRLAQEENAALRRERDLCLLRKIRRKNAVLRAECASSSSAVDGVGLVPTQAPVTEIGRDQSQQVSTKGASGCHVDSQDEVLRPPTLRDLDFLDQEADRIVQQEVGIRVGSGRAPNVMPAMDDYEDLIGKRGKKSGLRQVISDVRTQNAQLCPQECLRLEHVRNPIKFDDLDLRLFVSGEINIIDRHNISMVERNGRMQLLKQILYLAGYYEWRGILQFYATIIHQIEMGIKAWDSDFTEERSLVLLPYALASRTTERQASVGKRSTSSSGKSFDSSDRPWFCRSYQKGDCNKSAPHRGYIQGRGSVTVSHFCAKCFIVDKKQLQHPEFSETCPHYESHWLTVQKEPSRVDRQCVSLSDDVIQEALCNREGRLSFFIKAHNAVHASKLPNFIGCQIPVPSNIDCEFLANNLSGYKDKQIVQLLKYGCPISFSGDGSFNRKCKNHKGALEFPDQIDKFLTKELEAGAVLGPFQSSPFDQKLVISPLNTVPKKNSSERRVIVDLSFPKFDTSQSVNGGISKNFYLGEQAQLRYPSVDSLVNIMRSKGHGCLLFKRDLSRQGWGQFNSGIGIAAQFQFQFRNWNWNWNWWNWKWNWNWKPWNWNWNWNWKPELNFLLLLQQLLVNQPYPNFSFNIGGHNLSYDWLFMQQVLLGHCPLWCGHKRYLGRVPYSPWVDRGQKD